MIFHKSIGFPDHLIVPDKKLFLRYTTHALLRLKERTDQRRQPVKFVKITKRNLVEAWTNATGKNIQTCIVRIQFDKKRDIVLVIKPNFKKKTAKVFTIWLNLKKDQHKTFDKSKYDKP